MQKVLHIYSKGGDGRLAEVEIAFGKPLVSGSVDLEEADVQCPIEEIQKTYRGKINRIFQIKFRKEGKFMKKELTIFDKEKEFNDECKLLLDELVQKCRESQIPFFFSAAIKNDEEETIYINDGVMTGSSGIVLLNDQIKRHMAVAGGFIAVPKQREIVFDSDM